MTTTTKPAARRRHAYAWYPFVEGGWALTALALFLLIPVDQLHPVVLGLLVGPGALFAFVRVVAAIGHVLEPRPGGAR